MIMIMTQISKEKFFLCVGAFSGSQPRNQRWTIKMSSGPKYELLKTGMTDDKDEEEQLCTGNFGLLVFDGF